MTVTAMWVWHRKGGWNSKFNYVFCFMDSYPEFGFSEEAGALQDLLKAYDDGDDEAVRNILSLPLFKYMDNAVSKYMVFDWCIQWHWSILLAFVMLKSYDSLCLVWFIFLFCFASLDTYCDLSQHVFFHLLIQQPHLSVGYSTTVWVFCTKGEQVWLDLWKCHDMNMLRVLTAATFFDSFVLERYLEYFVKLRMPWRLPLYLEVVSMLFISWHSWTHSLCNCGLWSAFSLREREKWTVSPFHGLKV